MPTVSRLVSSVIFVLLCLSRARGHDEAEETSPEARDRMERLLNVFTIVKFPNEACNATGGNYYGTCFTATECTALGNISLKIPTTILHLPWRFLTLFQYFVLDIYFRSSAPGGTASGTCASGFGVCCTLTGRCGGSTSTNNTYFVADGGDTSPCSFKVCKASDDICQIRSNINDIYKLYCHYIVITSYIFAFYLDWVLIFSRFLLQ